ncbi:hypothetical protein BC937DRAFT_93575 [Endogone sp. FLAS-F59071]|nr:hypothetical protein BC937DRAFT_93575 [Endogone sp. FLAS-F59071]|eukprot:RUS14598.1 hypothetical protein BC937DRAFT_93575 [Endogone sp. FLAS-F59071]
MAGDKSKAPKWQREQVPDHKFDLIDMDEFYDPSCMSRMTYMSVFLVVVKSFALYIADLWTAGIILIFDHWSTGVAPKIPFYIGKWVYVGCILLSFLLLALDIRKARMIIASGDISYAFTSITAYRYYSFRSYAHYCFFNKINDSKKTMDEMAFFVFFQLKGWKRILFAEGPRQVIAGLTVYSIISAAWNTPPVGLKTKMIYYGDGWTQQLALMLMSFTCALWIISVTMGLIACICYVPLLCHIRGNLKEYCCHKIDKRIAELLKKQSRKRVKERNQQLLKAKKNGTLPSRNGFAPQPTLPDVDELLNTSDEKSYSQKYGDNGNYAYRTPPPPPAAVYNPYTNAYAPPPPPPREWNNSPYAPPQGSPPTRSATPGTSTITSKRSMTTLVAAQESAALSPPPRPGKVNTSPEGQQQGYYDADDHYRQDDRYAYAQGNGYYQTSNDTYQNYHYSPDQQYYANDSRSQRTYTSDPYQATQQQGYAAEGYQQQGYAAEGYQQQGYAAEGYQQQQGYTAEGYQQHQYADYDYGNQPRHDEYPESHRNPENEYSHYGGYFAEESARSPTPSSVPSIVPQQSAPVIYEELPAPVAYSLDQITYSARVEPQDPQRQFSLTPEPEARAREASPRGASRPVRDNMF